MRQAALKDVCTVVIASLALAACSDGPAVDAPDVSDPPTEADHSVVGLEELRAGFVEGLIVTAPRITEEQANCAFDEAVALGVTFDDFVAIESTPELEAKFAAAFRACGIS